MARESSGLLQRESNAVGRSDRVDGPLDRTVREVAVFADAPDRLVIRFGFEKSDRRQRDRSLSKVASDRLSQVGLRANKIQHVVDYLKRHAEVVAIRAERRDLCLAGEAQNCSGLRRRSKQ